MQAIYMRFSKYRNLGFKGSMSFSQYFLQNLMDMGSFFGLYYALYETTRGESYVHRQGSLNEPHADNS